MPAGEEPPAGSAPREESPEEQGHATLSQSKRHGLQVTWQVPSEAVDGFVLRYGEKPDALKDERKVPLSSLTQIEDPEFGPVFRYIIPDINPQNGLYVAVAAYKGDRISEFSDVMKDSSTAPRGY